MSQSTDRQKAGLNRFREFYESVGLTKPPAMTNGGANNDTMFTHSLPHSPTLFAQYKKLEAMIAPEQSLENKRSAGKPGPRRNKTSDITASEKESAFFTLVLKVDVLRQYVSDDSFSNNNQMTNVANKIKAELKKDIKLACDRLSQIDVFGLRVNLQLLVKLFDYVDFVLVNCKKLYGNLNIYKEIWQLLVCCFNRVDFEGLEKDCPELIEQLVQCFGSYFLSVEEDTRNYDGVFEFIVLNVQAIVEDKEIESAFCSQQIAKNALLASKAEKQPTFLNNRRDVIKGKFANLSWLAFKLHSETAVRVLLKVAREILDELDGIQINLSTSFHTMMRLVTETLTLYAHSKSHKKDSILVVASLKFFLNLFKRSEYIALVYTPGLLKLIADVGPSLFQSSPQTLCLTNKFLKLSLGSNASIETFHLLAKKLNVFDNFKLILSHLCKPEAKFWVKSKLEAPKTQHSRLEEQNKSSVGFDLLLMPPHYLVKVIRTTYRLLDSVTQKMILTANWNQKMVTELQGCCRQVIEHTFFFKVLPKEIQKLTLTFLESYLGIVSVLGRDSQRAYQHSLISFYQFNNVQLSSRVLSMLRRSRQYSEEEYSHISKRDLSVSFLEEGDEYSNKKLRSSVGALDIKSQLLEDEILSFQNFNLVQKSAPRFANDLLGKKESKSDSEEVINGKARFGQLPMPIKPQFDATEQIDKNIFTQEMSPSVVNRNKLQSLDQLNWTEATEERIPSPNTTPVETRIVEEELDDMPQIDLS
jgi:hypothetical protein